VVPLVAVLLIVTGAALLDTNTSNAPARPPVPPSADAVAPSGAESASWYCAGGSGTSGNMAVPTVYLTNVTAQSVQGTVHVVSDTGSTGNQAVTVPGHTQVAVVPGDLAQGSWLASTVNLDGGGVVASQSVSGSDGWAMTPCATETSHTWYFASGGTANGHDLFVSLYNPTVTDAVVDLGFRAPSGAESQPSQFQGILVPAQGLAVADVGSYVQDASDLSTDVVTRAGLVVADELEIATNGLRGVSLRLGAPGPMRAWALPRTVDVTNGAAAVHVYNPTGNFESVTASFRLPSGPTAPLDEQLPPGATWIVKLNTTSRLPHNDDFSTRITTNGGGVVVDRVLVSSPTAALPQWGAAPGADSSQWAAGHTWLLPAPGVSGHPARKGAAPFALALLDQGGRSVTVHLGVLTGTGVSPLAGGTLTISPAATTVVEPNVLGAAGLQPIVVSADGPLAVAEDLVPAGAPGVVTQPGIALP
jgi:hypothetical protein